MGVEGFKINPNVYDPERRNRIFVAMWTAIHAESTTVEGSAWIAAGEVLDAMEMIGGIVLATTSKVPADLHQVCKHHGEAIAALARHTTEFCDRTGASPFSAVLSGYETKQ